MSILSLIYYAAIASCGIQGAKKGIQNKLCIANVLVCSYLYALGGDIVRDIFILQIYPKAFSINDCLPEIAISFAFGLLYFKFDKYRKHLDIFSTIFDAAGLSQFIYIGASKVQNNNIVAVLSAIITALFGEITASAFSGESVKNIILSNAAYRITTVVGAFVYVILNELGIKDTNVKGILVFYTLMFVTLSNPNMRVANKQYFIKLSKSIQQNELFNLHLSYNPIFLQMYICNEHFFCKLPTYSFTKPMQSYTPNRSAIFLLHRILRM